MHFQSHVHGTVGDRLRHSLVIEHHDSSSAGSPPTAHLLRPLWPRCGNLILTDWAVSLFQIRDQVTRAIMLQLAQQGLATSDITAANG